MHQMWLSTYTHVFDLLEQEKIEWYAVVTYEALVLYHDQVVDELIEVVRSGVRRYQSRQNNLAYNATTDDRKDIDEKNDTKHSSQRRLHFHKNYDSYSYLKPSEHSVIKWNECYNKKNCRYQLKRLNQYIFPFLGYEYAGQTQNHTLLSSPGTVVVREEFGHVLYSSEGDSLKEFRKARGDKEFMNEMGYKPPSGMIDRMKSLQKRNENK